MKKERWSKEHQREIKVLRCSKGYLTMEEMATAVSEKGIEMGLFPEGYKMSKQSYNMREIGKVACTVDEIKVIAELLGLTFENTVAIFSR